MLLTSQILLNLMNKKIVYVSVLSLGKFGAKKISKIK